MPNSRSSSVSLFIDKMKMREIPTDTPFTNYFMYMGVTVHRPKIPT